MVKINDLTREFYEARIHDEKYQPLTAEEEAAVFKKRDELKRTLKNLINEARGANGNRKILQREIRRTEKKLEALREDFTNRNMRLVLHMASLIKRRKIYSTGFIDDDDLIEEGNWSLMKCWDGFSPSRGYKFSTYYCKAFFLGASRRNQTRQRKCLIQGVDSSEVDSEDRKNRPPSEILEARERKELLERTISDAINSLPEKEKDVIIRRYGFYGNPKMTLIEIGRMYDLTRERIRQIQRKVESKIEGYLRGEQQ